MRASSRAVASGVVVSPILRTASADPRWAFSKSLSNSEAPCFGAASAWAKARDAIKNTIKPAKVSQYNDTITAGQALSNGQIDAVVIDVPIAIPMTQQFTNLEVIGQFLTNEGYAMTFEKGSPLVACVNQALAAMTSDGTLKSLTDKSFPGTTADIPVFK